MQHRPVEIGGMLGRPFCNMRVEEPQTREFGRPIRTAFPLTRAGIHCEQT
jgi:hypothetical protein